MLHKLPPEGLLRLKIVGSVIIILPILIFASLLVIKAFEHSGSWVASFAIASAAAIAVVAVICAFWCAGTRARLVYSSLLIIPVYFTAIFMEPGVSLESFGAVTWLQLGASVLAWAIFIAVASTCVWVFRGFIRTERP